MAWLRGSRQSRETPPAEDDSLLATAEWFGDGTAFTSDRLLTAALLQMAGTHTPDGTPRGLLIPAAGGNHHGAHLPRQRGGGLPLAR